MATESYSQRQKRMATRKKNVGAAKSYVKKAVKKAKTMPLMPSAKKAKAKRVAKQAEAQRKRLVRYRKLDHSLRANSRGTSVAKERAKKKK